MLDELLNTTRLLFFADGLIRVQVVDATDANGVYETVGADLLLSHFSIRDGIRRDLTEKQALRRVLDAAGRDPKTGKPRDSSKFDTRRRSILRNLLFKACGKVLSHSTNGTTISTSLRLAPGSKPQAASERVKVGEYRGSHKGYPIYGTEHDVVGSEADFASAALALGDPVVDDLIVMQAKLVDTVAGVDASDPRRVWKLQCLRQARSGAEACERFMIDDTKSWIVAPTLRGVKMRLKSIFAEREQEEIDRLNRLECEKAYREAETRREERRRQQAAIDAMPKEDIDALAVI